MSTVAYAWGAPVSFTDGRLRLHAHFWQSPFAMCAATIVTAQFILLNGALSGSLDISREAMLAFTLVAAAMLAAGVFPQWNYLAYDAEGLEQHAGLTRFHVAWEDVRAVNIVSGGVRISYLDRRPKGAPKVRSGVVQNRYNIDTAVLHRLLEFAWHRGAGIAH